MFFTMKKLLMFSIFAAQVSKISACNMQQAARDATNNANCFVQASKEYDACDVIRKSVDCYSAACCNTMAETYKITMPDCNVQCSGCFPASAEVELDTNEKVTMDNLKVGDKVYVGEGQYSEVYFFSTAEQSSVSAFVKLETTATELVLTSGHYLYVNDELMKAGRVMVGDTVTLADGSKAMVTSVSLSNSPGLYNPHTLDGDIVVNGVKTSTYTDAVHPKLAHVLLYPLRVLYEAGVSFGEGFSSTVKKLPRPVLDLLQV